MAGLRFHFDIGLTWGDDNVNNDASNTDGDAVTREPRIVQSIKFNANNDNNADEDYYNEPKEEESLADENDSELTQLKTNLTDEYDNTLWFPDVDRNLIITDDSYYDGYDYALQLSYDKAITIAISRNSSYYASGLLHDVYSFNNDKNSIIAINDYIVSYLDYLRNRKMKGITDNTELYVIIDDVNIYALQLIEYFAGSDVHFIIGNVPANSDLVDTLTRLFYNNVKIL